MPNSLVIRLPATGDAPVDWVTVDSAGIGTPACGELEQVRQLAENRKIVILAPASKVLRLNARIPLKGNARIRHGEGSDKLGGLPPRT